jgi:hypothetical protein
MDLKTLVEDQKKPWLNIVANSIKLTGGAFPSEGSAWVKISGSADAPTFITTAVYEPLVNNWTPDEKTAPTFPAGSLKKGSIVRFRVTGLVRGDATGFIDFISPLSAQQAVQVPNFPGASQFMTLQMTHYVQEEPSAGAKIITQFLWYAGNAPSLEARTISTNVDTSVDVQYVPQAKFTTPSAANILTQETVELDFA